MKLGWIWYRKEIRRAPGTTFAAELGSSLQAGMEVYEWSG